jgi:peptide/nickel transport system substrate-binding protein
MRKLFAIVLILAVCALFVLGCQSSTPTPTSPSITTSTSPAAPATSAKPTSAVPTTAATQPAVTATTTTATKPAATTAAAANAQYGGKVTVIDPSTVGGPLGLPWLNRLNYVGSQLVHEPILATLSDATIYSKLAESWDIVADPSNPSFTFHLKKGVKFTDGSDWNAQAFVWNMKKYAEGGVLVTSRYIKSYDIIDDYTVKFPLTQWRNTLLAAFEMSPVESPTAYQKNGEDWMRNNMVGTGPYKLTNFSRDVLFGTVKNENYWQQGKPYLSEVKYLSVVDELTRLALFKSGGGDILNLNKNARVAADFKSQGYPVFTQPAGTVALVPDSANTDSPWSNIKVRQAAEYAIDREALARAFGFGINTAAYQWYPAGTMPYVPTLAARKYDLAKAKQLMTEAGFPNGFKTKIISDGTISSDVVVSMQYYLSTIGIKADLEFPTAASYNEITFSSWTNALLCTTMRTGANPTQGITFTAPPRVQYKSNKNPDNWTTTYNKIMTTPAIDQNVLWDGFTAFYNDSTLIPVLYVSDIFVVSDKLKDHGIGTRSSSTGWTFDISWLSK